jgi:hypothetical protein
LLVTASVVPSSQIPVTVMVQVIRSSETLFLREPHGVTSQKTELFTVAAVKTSNLTTLYLPTCRKCLSAANLGHKMAGATFWTSSLKLRITCGYVDSSAVASLRFRRNLNASDKIYAFSSAGRDKVTAVSPHLISYISRAS